MRICVFGAGAIGGYLGVRLAASGAAEVSLVARGAHLEAIRENGLSLIEDGETVTRRLPASDDPADLGPQDVVIIALKAHSVPAVAERMKPLIGPDTAIVTAQNGVPWWYFYGEPGPYEGRRLDSVDPGGVLWDTLGPERAVGCVVYPAAELDGPGVVRHVSGNRFPLGEPDGSKSDRIRAISQAMIASGFKSPIRPRIRNDIWVKLWGNLAFNPLSALTGATLDVLATKPDLRAVSKAMMEEAKAIGETLGVSFPVEVDRRIDGAGEVGAHKTSMLQDLELGRPMEIDALVSSVQELGRLTELPTPTIDVVLALVKQRAIEAGCYAGQGGGC